GISESVLSLSSLRGFPDPSVLKRRTTMRAILMRSIALPCNALCPRRFHSLRVSTPYLRIAEFGIDTHWMQLALQRRGVPSHHSRSPSRGSW
ncbi:hypothetical protein PENTCL1PPCAC_24445, partial [Pristionchus entomophagus]